MVRDEGFGEGRRREDGLEGSSVRGQAIVKRELRLRLLRWDVVCLEVGRGYRGGGGRQIC
jgi:hypothetical protein